MLRLAGKRGGEPLEPADWEAYYRLGTHRLSKLGQRVFLALPTNPRYMFCGAPFAGFGSKLVKPFGYRPSRKNPHLCATCVELSPPGGMNMQVGVLFADVRGFTTMAESLGPQEASGLLRRFYACAEDVLFPDALIDKLIGDEVMALYVPLLGRLPDPARTMVEHAEGLLRAVGYGSSEGPFLDVGIGLDFGDAFVGNIGQRSLYDFTAVGDVVNTASRLQSQAAGGEVVMSGRVASSLARPIGERTELALKGKAEPVTAYRLRVGGGD